MGEVAEMMDVTPTTVRFWEKKIDILTPQKNARGKRMFSPEDVQLLKTIYHLVKERGMTLAGAHKYLKANRKTIERDMQIAERLQSIRALLVEVRNELGEDGIVVENAVTEDITGSNEPLIEVVSEIGEEAAEVAAESEEIAVEVAADVAEIEQEIHAETEPEIEPQTGPETKPLYIEQTLF